MGPGLTNYCTCGPHGSASSAMLLNRFLGVQRRKTRGRAFSKLALVMCLNYVALLKLLVSSELHSTGECH